MPTALITGVTGYLGSNLAKVLVSNGWVVAGLKRTCSDVTRLEGLNENVQLYDIDLIGVQEAVVSVKPDVIIHAATTYGRGSETPFDLFDANIVLPMEVLRAASLLNVSLFINCDTSLDRLVSTYAMSKAHFRDWMVASSSSINIRIINLRLEHFFGPNDDLSKFTTYVMNSCIENRAEIDLTEGAQLRDFIYIDDVVSAFLVIINHHLERNDKYTEYEVGSGESVTVRHFVELIKELTHSKTVLNFGAIPYRFNEPSECRANIEQLKLLGWHPVFSLGSGVMKVIESYRM